MTISKEMSLPTSSEHLIERRIDMTDFEQALMNRDHISKAEAKRRRAEAREELYNMLADDADYDDIEEMMMYEFGLEMDYIDDLI